MIPPRSMGQLKLKVPYNDKLLKNKVLFHPWEEEDSLTKDEWDDFELPESLVKIRKTQNGKMYSYVKYINHSHHAKEIKQGEILGGVSIDAEVINWKDFDEKNEQNFINNVHVLNDCEKVESRGNKIKNLLVDKVIPGSEEEAALHRVMEKHMGVIQLEGEKFKTTDTVEHYIDYEGPPTLFTPAYKTAKIDQMDIDREIDRLESEEHIKPSKSGFNSPLIPVRKKNGTLRICQDFRNINKFTNKQRFPLPEINDILSSLHEARYFCVIDLKSGYYQIRLAEASRPLTAFRTSKGCWEYISMPFGLSNSPSSMQRLMLNVTNGIPNCHVFLDDILVFGSTLKECELHLDRVLSRLNEHNLTIQLPKCSFFTKSCTYLGHVISDQGISPDPEKVRAIKEFPRPRDLQAVRSFLGLTSYYRKFIPNYSKVASPLHDITKGCSGKGKNVNVKWTSEEDESFEKLKEAIEVNALLKYPNYSKGFRLTVDASATALGGCLSQLDEAGRDRPVSFFSKKLLPAEQRYDAINREALAIIYGLKVNRQTILGREVSILSDNAPLTWMLKTSAPSSRVARWLILLSEYNITSISHVAGRENIVADALSRNVPDTVDILLDEIPSLNVIQQVEEDVVEWNVENIGAEQQKFPLYKEIVNFLTGKRAQLPRHLAAPINQFELENSILYFKSQNEYKNVKYRVCVPPSYYRKALVLAHSVPISGHTGIHSTLERLKTFAFWPTMAACVKDFVKSCAICLKTKNYKGSKAPILRNPEVDRPYDRLNMDLIGPLPVSNDNNRYILSLVDVLTRYGFAVPIPDKSANTVSRALINHVIGPFGPPRSIYSDSGPEFTAEVTKQVLNAMQVHQRHITVYRPEASGQIERLNGTLISILRALVHEHPGTWDASLPLALLAYNSSFHRTIKESPYFLFFMRDPNLPYSTLLGSQSPWYCIDSVKHEIMLRCNTAFSLAKKYIEEGRTEQEEYRNKKAKLRPIQIGDRVWVRKMANVTKLGTKYLGPMRVIKVLGVIFWIRDLSTHNIYKVHIDRLKHEQNVNVSESSNIRSAFPVSDSDVQHECELVSKEELQKAGMNEPRKTETLGEKFINEKVSSDISSGNEKLQVTRSSKVGSHGKINNNEQNQSEYEEISGKMLVSPDAAMSPATYPLRNRGVEVRDHSWVMDSPVEYKG